MSQHDMTLDNASGLGFRTDANAALQALASQSSGAAAPSPTFPCQIWGDTGTGRLKQRNAANNAWLDKGPLDAPLRDAASQGEFVADTGAANAYVCNFVPAITTRSESTPIRFKASNANSGACTINDGVGVVALVGSTHSALQGGEIIANGIAWIQWNTSVGGGSYVLLSCTGGAEQAVPATKSQHAVPLSQIQALPSAIQSMSASVASNALTMTWAAQPLVFRNTTLTSGAPHFAYPSGTLSITVPSGATLGTANGVSATIILLLAYNAGTPVLCVANLSGGLDLSETGLISPTTISSGATSAGVIYSASAVAGGSPYRVIGCAKLTEATAGTWATAPTLVQGGGGQALAAMQSFGYGQSWQNMTASRALGTVYTNTTDKMIMVHFYCISTSSAYPAANSDTATLVGTTQNTPGTTMDHAFAVMPGKTYSASVSAGTISSLAWMELR